VSGIDAQHLRLLEAILFAATEALPHRVLVQRLPENADVRGLLEELRRHYSGRGVNLVQSGGSWAFRTAPDLGPLLARERQEVRKLGRAMVETLAIIAYHQPVTRAEVEEIRGVGFNRGVLDVLFEQGWVRPMGRRKTPGRPVTWGTTDAFLDHFGMASLDELPGLDELKAAGLLDARPAVDVLRGSEADGSESRAADGEGRGEGSDEEALPGLLDDEELEAREASDETAS
jgi:segregation and condensation protein B